jgi:hypothetical protein
MDLRDCLELPAKLSIVTGSGEIYTSDLSVTFDHTLNVEPRRRKGSLFEPFCGLFREEQQEANNNLTVDAPEPAGTLFD